MPQPTENDTLAQMASLLQKGALTALVGAGVSARAGYPTWSDLLQAIHARAAERGKTNGRPSRGDDLLWRAQEYCDLLGRESFATIIQEQFARRETSDRAVHDLVSLPFRHFLTTNYDHLLEDVATLQSGKEPRTFDWTDQARLDGFLCEGGTRLGRCFVHIHGSTSRPKDIVLTDNDYVDRYLRSHDASRKLFAIFATHRIVFVGFSLNDPELTLLLREVRASVISSEPRHFGIFARNPAEPSHEVALLRHRMLGKYGIRPIFYTASNGHGGLADVLHNLRALVEETGMPEAVWSADAARPELPLDDPQKGRWGNAPARNGRVLSAVVRPTPDSVDWFEVVLRVESTDANRPLEGEVIFHLHDTFFPAIRSLQVIDGRAELRLLAWGAFTVGAEADGGQTKLERDLATLSGAPPTFTSR